MNRLVVRAPNHLGELILSVPALQRAATDEAAAGRSPPIVQIVSWLAPLLRWAVTGAEVLPLDNRRACRRAARAIRIAADGFSIRGVTLTPSFSSAFILRLAGVTSLRGTAGDFRTWLLTDAVDRAPLLAGHRVDEYLSLLGYDRAAEPARPALGDTAVARTAWDSAERRLGISGAMRGQRVVGLFPGANGHARRWPATRFEDLADRLSAVAGRTLVFGGTSDRPLTERVAARAGKGGIDLGGRTSLMELAGGLLSCDLLITNDTGPMHLAAALGVPVLALEGPADIRQTRPLGARVRLLGRFDLPCVPCVRNECPRTGVGYELAEARGECLRLIEVREVEAAALAMLNEESA
ncbi:MAG: glycosyltransferase family 9 protein [Gemmatimonadota bacterium]|nr:glycosyltransferase family 9 protein [Gemmatimonadota bacterium]MDH3427214.1 glycosyltransferase family 9 protein [Gemmatimonadota bacterium]